MVIIKLQGGLGNQLFQYCYGCHLEKKLDRKVKFDSSWYNNSNFDLVLQDIGIVFKEVNFRDKINVLGLLPFPKLAKQLTKTFPVYKSYGIEGHSYIEKNRMYYEGYWQEYKYVENNLEYLKQKIKKARINKNNLNFKETTTENVAIHVRGGDYFTSKNHFVLDYNYYETAINLIYNKKEKLKLLFFTDDKVYCRKLISKLKIENYEVFSSEDPVIDFLRMTTCQHYIIANSTFSWWAAILGQKSNSIMIGPSKWSINKKNNFTDSFLFKFIKLNV